MLRMKYFCLVISLASLVHVLFNSSTGLPIQTDDTKKRVSCPAYTGQRLHYSLKVIHRLISANEGNNDTNTVGNRLEIAVSVTYVQQNVYQLNVHQVDVFEWNKDSYRKCEECKRSYEALVALPFQFSWRDDETCLSPCGHPEDSISNLQRSIVSLFLTSLGDSPVTGRWTRWEENDILGRCMTEIMKYPGGDRDWISVRKKRDLSDCTDRPTQIFKNFQSRTIPGQQDADATGRTYSDHLFVRVREGYRLKTAKVVQEIPVGPVRVELRLLLDYRWTESAPQQLDLCSLDVCMPVAYKFNNKRASRNRSTCQGANDYLGELKAGRLSKSEGLTQVVHKMRACSRVEIETIFEENVILRSFLLDTLPWVGTDAATTLMKEIVVDDKFSVSWSQKQSLVTHMARMPLGYCSSCHALLHITTIVTTHPYDIYMITALGSLVGRIVNSPSPCPSKTEKAMLWLQSQLWDLHENVIHESGDADKDNARLHRLVAILEALGRAHWPKALPILEKYTWVGVPLPACLASFKAMSYTASFAPIRVQETTMRVYNDASRNGEVRIAAFTTFMSTINCDSPSPADTLRKIVWSIHLEKDRHVQSAVYTHLKELETTKDPALKCRQRAVSDVIWESNMHSLCSHCDRGYLSSKMDLSYASAADLLKWFDSSDVGTESLGGSSWSTVVFPDNGTVPSSWSWILALDFFGYRIDALELNFASTFLDDLMRNLFGPVGYFHQGIKKFQTSGLPMKSFYTNAPQRRDFAEVFIKLFGQDVIWNMFNADQIAAALDGSPSLDRVRQVVTKTLRSEFSYDNLAKVLETLADYWNYLWKGDIYRDQLFFQKTINVAEMRAQLSTITGVPLALTVNAAVDVELRAQLNVTNPSWFPMTVNFDSNWQSRFAGHFIGEVLLADNSVQPSIRFSANSSGQWTQEANVVVSPNAEKPVTVTYTCLPHPHNDSQLLRYSSELVATTRREKTRLIFRSPRQKEMLLNISGGPLEMDFVTYVSYIPGKVGVLGSLLPFDVQFKLNPKTPWIPPKYRITLWNNTAITWNEGSLHADWHTVGTNSSANASVVWSTPHSELLKWLITEISMWTTLKAPEKLFHFRSETGPNTTACFLWYASDHNISGCIRSNDSQWYGNVSYTTEGSKSPNNLWDHNILVEGRGSVDGVTSDLAKVDVWVPARQAHRHFEINAMHNTFMWDITASWNEFSHLNIGMILPFPASSFTCHIFGNHVITFDGFQFIYDAAPNCTYVLARHRHPDDTFAVTLTGADVNIYTDGMVYSLTEQGTAFKVNGRYVNLPYKVHHEVAVSVVPYLDLRYVLVDLASGLRLFYYDGIVQLIVSGFYGHQMAGLCGNADYAYGRTEDNEMMMPDMNVANSSQSFVKSWNIGSENCGSLSSIRDVSSANVSLNVCLQFFKRMAEAQIDVPGHIHFRNACNLDAELGIGHDPSLHAYIMAAHTAGAVVDVCGYGSWSNWSQCNGGKRYRTRPLKYRKQMCNHEREVKSCEEKPAGGTCAITKKHAVVNFAGRVCRSIRKVKTCIGGKWCDSKKTSLKKLVPFRCNTNQGKGTVYLAYQRVSECVWIQGS